MPVDGRRRRRCSKRRSEGTERRSRRSTAATATSCSRYLRRRVAEPEVAFDLTAETFAAALVSLGRYEPGRGPAAGWLVGIAQQQAAREPAPRAGRGGRAAAAAARADRGRRRRPAGRRGTRRGGRRRTRAAPGRAARRAARGDPRTRARRARLRGHRRGTALLAAGRAPAGVARPANPANEDRRAIVSAFDTLEQQLRDSARARGRRRRAARRLAMLARGARRARPALRRGVTVPAAAPERAASPRGATPRAAAPHVGPGRTAALRGATARAVAWLVPLALAAVAVVLVVRSPAPPDEREASVPTPGPTWTPVLGDARRGHPSISRSPVPAKQAAVYGVLRRPPAAADRTRAVKDLLAHLSPSMLRGVRVDAVRRLDEHGGRTTILISAEILRMNPRDPGDDIRDGLCVMTGDAGGGAGGTCGSFHDALVGRMRTTLPPRGLAPDASRARHRARPRWAHDLDDPAQQLLRRRLGGRVRRGRDRPPALLRRRRAGVAHVRLMVVTRR